MFEFGWTEEDALVFQALSWPVPRVSIAHGLATGDNTGRLRRWRLSLPAGGSLTLTPDGDLASAHSSYIFAVIGVGDGLWSGGDDCRIRRWACEGALAPAQEIACPSPVLALSPLPEAAGLVAGLEDGSACVWCADASRAASSAQTAEFQAAAAARTVALDAEAAGLPPAAAAPAAGGAASGGYAINFPVGCRAAIAPCRCRGTLAKTPLLSPSDSWPRTAFLRIITRTWCSSCATRTSATT